MSRLRSRRYAAHGDAGGRMMQWLNIVVLTGGLAMLLLTRESFSTWVSIFVDDLGGTADEVAVAPPSETAPAATTEPEPPPRVVGIEPPYITATRSASARVDRARASAVASRSASEGEDEAPQAPDSVNTDDVQP